MELRSFIQTCRQAMGLMMIVMMLAFSGCITNGRRNLVSQYAKVIPSAPDTPSSSWSSAKMDAVFVDGYIEASKRFRDEANNHEEEEGRAHFRDLSDFFAERARNPKTPDVEGGHNCVHLTTVFGSERNGRRVLQAAAVASELPHVPPIFRGMVIETFVEMVTGGRFEKPYRLPDSLIEEFMHALHSLEAFNANHQYFHAGIALERLQMHITNHSI